jgi:CheY-like chemotaxis protein
MADIQQTAHILIVDDDPETRGLLRAALAPEGFSVSEASSGPTMIAAIAGKRPDLITLDLKTA